jgi:hypothetical protein
MYIMFTAKLFYELQVNAPRSQISAPQPGVKLSVTQAQLEFLNDISKRCHTFDSRDQTEESFEDSQYSSFKGAVKAGCSLSVLRVTLGNRNNITEKLFARLFADELLVNYDAVKNLKAQIDHEQDVVKQRACMDIFRAHSGFIEKISRLSMVFSYLPGDPEVQKMLIELIDSGKLIAPVDSKQIRDARDKQENELCDTLIAFYAANGSPADFILHELIPIGTFIKLQMMIAERAVAAEKANAPLAPAEIVPDILDFTRMKC